MKLDMGGSKSDPGGSRSTVEARCNEVEERRVGVKVQAKMAMEMDGKVRMSCVELR